MSVRSVLLAVAISACGALPALAGRVPTPPGVEYRSDIPAAQRRVFYGELHLHTSQSFDAWTFGTKVTPNMAYKFGRGETVMIQPSQLALQEGMKVAKPVPAKRAWPLDFMAVTDHSEWMGVLTQLDKPGNAFAQTPAGRKIRKDPKSGFYLVADKTKLAETSKRVHAAQAMRDAWSSEIAAANANYEPGKFTTFIAYEWSSMAQGKYNLHRNVFFNADHAPMPFSSADSDRPEDLWKYLDRVRAEGIDVIAIPHNGNASGGLMYDWNNSDGRPIDEHYAQERALNEPLTEIVQTKGQSDTVPSLSPNDEFANFEIFDRLLTWPGVKSNPNGSYVRQAFGRGLVIQSKVGINPFKYGVVGATDIHNGLSTSDEDAVANGPFGLDPNTMLPHGRTAKLALNIIRMPSRLDVNARVNHAKPTLENFPERSSGGLTGVWAEKNTRNSIFAALKRKETFATSGPRIRVRMFGGWNFSPAMIKSGAWVTKAYAHGVPMGSDLPVRRKGRGAPWFILEAAKAPDGANLDRVQVIKVWLEGSSYKEKVFDVALSGGRKDDPRTGRAPDVGNTVNLKTGKYTNSIGAPILRTVWRDPEFDPAKPAVYYARVLQIPTPRWTTLLAIKNRLPTPPHVAKTIQERAWTSPIWYTPAPAAKKS